MPQMPTYTLQQGRIIDPANGVDRIDNLHIADGAILAIGPPPAGFHADIEIDARQHIICPGIIDLWSRLQDPCLHDKTSIDSELTAAAAAGVTSLCVPPDRTPITDSPALVEMIRRCAKESGQLQLHPIGALTKGLKGEQISEMAALKASGCRIVSNARVAITDTLTLRRAMEYAASHEMMVFLHPEDPWLANHGVMHEGAVSTRLGLPAIPTTAESIAVARDLALIEQTGVNAHFCQLSSSKALTLVQEAQAKGMPVTAGVSIAHLFLSDMDVVEYNSNCHVQPPFRTLADQQALRQGLANGTIQNICSDHNPLPEDAKLAPFQATLPGASTLDVLLPLALKLVAENTLTLTQAIAAITVQPARILASHSGALTPGSPADLLIIDPEHNWRVTPETLFSKGLNCPFLHWEMHGRVQYTFYSGRQIFSLRAHRP